MGLPGVNINVLTDGLGASVSSDDAIMGLVLSGPAPSGLAISTPKAIFSLQGAKDLGIDADYDTANSIDTYQQIADFYTFAPKGTELWIMIIPQTTTLESACDKDNNVVKALLNAASGRVKGWGIHRIPDGAYVPTFTTGLDDDVNAAVLKADALCKQFESEYNPCFSIVGGRAFQGDVGSLKDFHTNTNQYANVFMGSLTTDGHPAVGFVLGKLASIPVHRKISRVKDGDIGTTAAYLTDGNTIETYQDAQDALHDKGYSFFRTIQNKSGYYFSSDPTAVSTANDFSFLANVRVIQKGLRIAYATMVEELDDDIDVNESGYLDGSIIGYYQSKLKSAIQNQMGDNLSTGNSVKVELSANQNVLASSKVKIDKLGLRPKGYSSLIEIDLGLENPQTT